MKTKTSSNPYEVHHAWDAGEDAFVLYGFSPNFPGTLWSRAINRVEGRATSDGMVEVKTFKKGKLMEIEILQRADFLSGLEYLVNSMLPLGWEFIAISHHKQTNPDRDGGWCWENLGPEEYMEYDR